MSKMDTIRKGFDDWMVGRPDIIQQMGKIYKPWWTYSHNGVIGQLAAYQEDGLVRFVPGGLVSRDMPDYMPPEGIASCDGPHVFKSGRVAYLVNPSELQILDKGPEDEAP